MLPYRLVIILTVLMASLFVLYVISVFIRNKILGITEQEYQNLITEIRNADNKIDELNKIGLLVVENSGSKKFKLNPKDKRAILLALIE